EHGEHVFQRKRLEVEAVGGVVIGGDGFRVAVHHHRLVAVFFQRERGGAAAIIEFNSLPDPAGAAAEDDNLRPVDGGGFVLFLVGRIQIRRKGFELGGAC